MPRKLLVGLPVALTCFFIGCRVNCSVSTSLHEPGVPNALVTRPWVEDQIALSGVYVDVPWHLQSMHVPLPKEIKVTQWAWLGHEAEGLNVMASRVVYAYGTATSLDGAADGVVEYTEMGVSPDSLISVKASKEGRQKEI